MHTSRTLDNRSWLLALLAAASFVPTLAVAQGTQKQAVSKKHVRVYGQALRGHKAGVSCADYSPDGKLVVTSGAAGQLKLWTANNGKLKKTIAAHQGDTHFACFFAAGARTCCRESLTRVHTHTHVHVPMHARAHARI